MKAYRLIHKDYDGELIFGLPFPYNQLSGEKKINNLLNNIKPWKHCIPYYKNSKFAFISFDALLSFLFGNFNNEYTEQELIDIENNFYVQSFDLITWSSGLSKLLCTYFDDEINKDSIKNISLNELRNCTYKYIKQDFVPKDDIKLTKEEYYNNIKTYYNK